MWLLSSFPEIVCEENGRSVAEQPVLVFLGNAYQFAWCSAVSTSPAKGLAVFVCLSVHKEAHIGPVTRLLPLCCPVLLMVQVLDDQMLFSIFIRDVKMWNRLSVECLNITQFKNKKRDHFYEV